MRVLFLTGDYPPQTSGIGDYTYQLTQHLIQRHHQVFVLTSALHDGEEPQEDSKNVFRLVKTWNDSAFVPIRKAIQENSIDIVHIQFHTCSFERKFFIHGLPLKLRILFPKLKVVTTYHEFASPFLRFSLIPMMLSSHVNILTNDRDQARFQKMIPGFFFNKKFTYIPLGANILRCPLDDDEKGSIRESLDVDQGGFLIARFGFIHKEALKQLKVVFSAIKKLKEEAKPVKLLLIGKVEADAHSLLEHEIQSHALSDTVFVAGKMEASGVSKYFQAIDFAVAPYADGVSERRAAFLSLLMHGVPTLVTKKGYFPSRLRHKQNVWGVEENAEKNAWYQGIKTLMEDFVLRKKIASNLKKIQTHYRWETIAEETEKAYSCL